MFLGSSGEPHGLQWQQQDAASYSWAEEPLRGSALSVSGLCDLVFPSGWEETNLAKV